MLTIGDGALSVAVEAAKGSPSWVAAGVFARETLDRTGLNVRVGEGSTEYTLVLRTVTPGSWAALMKERPGLGELEAEGYCIETHPDPQGRIYVLAKSEIGIVAGIGKLLRLAQYSRGTLRIPQTSLVSNPRMPVRGMYLATHFGNFYEAAPAEAVDRVIEDFALWGSNSLMVWFDMHQYSGLDDPAAQKHLAKLRRMGRTAHSLGMKFGLTCIANEGYGNSPVELRVPVRNPGNYGVEMCPSIPEGMDLIVRNLTEAASTFPDVDTFWLWPYDQGGCWCEKCSPWGGNGFIRASERLSESFLKRFPKAEIWLSTWKMDYFGHMQGEIDGLVKWLDAKRPKWVSGIITGQDEYSVQKRLLDRPEPERYPLVSFPEISMYNMFPWGGFGATCLPEFNEKVQGLMRGFVSGGWPYSEGIYEDLSKVQWLAFYWDPDRKADDVLREYGSYYLAPEAADQFVRMAHLLEATHTRSGWSVRSLAGASEAWSIAKSIDGRIGEKAEKSWRWRLLYDRAAIDGILSEGSVTDQATQERLDPYCKEIVQICHLTATHLRPPDFPKRRTDDNIAFGRPVTASSTLTGYEDSAKQLVDSVLPQADPGNFWANDAEKEKTSHVTIDLGPGARFDEFRLQFRALDGKYRFVPSEVTFYASSDGKTFDPLSIVCPDPSGVEAGPFVSVTCVPKENADYSPELWRYRLAGGSRQGRYVRVVLGPSQCTEPPYAGTLELTEIEVAGER